MNIKWRQFSTHGMSAIKFRFNWIWTLMFDGYVWETTYFSFGFNRSNCFILYWSSGNRRRRRLHITTCLCEVIRLFSICAHSIAHRQQLIQLKIPILGSLVSSTGNNSICDQNRLAHRLEWKWNNKTRNAAVKITTLDYTATRARDNHLAKHFILFKIVETNGNGVRTFALRVELSRRTRILNSQRTCHFFPQGAIETTLIVYLKSKTQCAKPLLWIGNTIEKCTRLQKAHTLTHSRHTADDCPLLEDYAKKERTRERERGREVEGVCNEIAEKKKRENDRADERPPVF